MPGLFSVRNVATAPIRCVTASCRTREPVAWRGVDVACESQSSLTRGIFRE